MNKSLTGKKALVTGASKGIGAAIAQHLAEAGATVVVNYSSDKAGAEKCVAAIKKKGGNAIAIKANVGVHAEIKELFAEADKFLGGELDVLVNNAGIFFNTPLEAIEPDVFHKVFNVNVLGMMLCIQEAVKRIPAKGGGIINVSSVVAAKGFPGSAVYSASKGAVDSMTRVFSSELAPKNIRVNAINPGLVITEGTEAAGFASGEFAKIWEQMSALKRAGTTADIAPVVVFLASPESGWLTGETIYTTGGVR